jgi:nucleotide-binding universal stress UspA family protein
MGVAFSVQDSLTKRSITMIGFERILFPVAFTPQCRIAAPYVASYARQFNAEVVLLHVETLPVEPYVWEPQTGRLTELLNQFMVDKFTGLNVKRTVKSGDAAHEIVRYVVNEKADLIMMPTHGRGPFRRFVLGSVAAKVLHDAPCPVWTSAHLDTERLRTPESPSNVVCAVDLDDVGVHTLRYAGNFARRIGSKLAVAHAVPAVETLPEAYMDAELRADLMEAARLRLAEMQTLAGSDAVVCVGAGNIARFVSSTAQSHNADLVIIGRGGNTLLGRLRTHDYAIIRECECPVLSI